jgi:hypothetical protein
LKRQRILVWSAYSSWVFHALHEATIFHALRLRGHEPMLLGCDQLFDTCDAFRETTAPRTQDSCATCHHRGASVMEQMKCDPIWLGTLIPPAWKQEIRTWVDALPADTLCEARFDGQPVGDWAKSSILYQTRAHAFDPTTPRVVSLARDLVAGTAWMHRAFSAVVDNLRPDVILTFNGRMFTTRVVVEVARARGIRFLTHERSIERNTLRVHADRVTHQLVNYEEPWERWKDVPLDREALESVGRWLHRRRHGLSQGWAQFSPPPQDDAALRARLRLGDRPVIAVFSSSQDETATFPEYREGAFPDSTAWLPAVLRLAARMPSHIFVLRMHPNLLGVRSMGASAEALAEVAQLERSLPENCRLVRPEADVSSYTLADVASVGIVYATMLGVEMAAEGQPVVAVARGWYGRSGVARFAGSEEEMETQVRAAAAEGRSREIARRAWRHIHAVWSELSIDFPLVDEPKGKVAQPTFSDLGDLAPGRLPALDQICRMILEGGTFRPPPTAKERGRSEADEDEWFAGRLP